VICDSPLRVPDAAHAAQIAAETGARLAIIECTCPDAAVWRDRINSRKALNLPAHHQTDWEVMQAHLKAPAASADHTDLSSSRNLVVQTVGPVDALCEQVIVWLVTQIDL
jgi:predicted kinase